MSEDSGAFMARVATLADVDAIVSVLTTAFRRDPLWGPVFNTELSEEHRAAQAAVMWRLYATSALRYPWTFITVNATAAAVWIPPGGTELMTAEEAGLEDLLSRTAGAESAASIVAIYEQLDAAHPVEPCFYLSLLGVHDDHRGAGLGMALLADSLARIDALGAPAYLESSNPANNARYESVGFRERGQIVTASGHVVTTMWCPGR